MTCDLGLNRKFRLVVVDFFGHFRPLWKGWFGCQKAAVQKGCSAKGCTQIGCMLNSYRQKAAILIRTFNAQWKLNIEQHNTTIYVFCNPRDLWITKWQYLGKYFSIKVTQITFCTPTALDSYIKSSDVNGNSSTYDHLCFLQP